MFSEEFEILFNIVEKELGITKALVTSKSRKEEILDARRIMSFIIKSNSKLSLRKIGDKLGKKDHATILNAIKKHNEFYETNKDYTEKFDKVNFKFLSSSVVSNKIISTIKQLNSRKRTITKYIDQQIEIVKNENASNKSNKLNIGLFVGSFNPIHNGHMIIANTAMNHCNFDEVWFLVSPQSPDKINHNDMLNYDDRIELIKNSIVDNPHFKVCSIEKDLPKPSYTSNTMDALRSKYESYTFSLILGSDNLAKINTWKRFEDILLFHKIYYFVRPDFGDAYLENAKIYKAEKINSISSIDISSTKIRDIISKGESLESLRYLVPDKCLYLIEEKGFYKKIKPETINETNN